MANDQHPVHVTIFDRSGRRKITAYDDSMWGWPNEESITDYVMSFPAKKHSDNVVEVDDGSLAWRFRTGRLAGQTSVRLLRKSAPKSHVHHERQHATRKKSPEFDWEVSGPADLARQGFMRGVKEKIKRIGVEAYDKDSGAYLGSGFFSATSKTDALKQAKTSSWYFKTLAENSYKPLVMKAA